MYSNKNTPFYDDYKNSFYRDLDGKSYLPSRIDMSNYSYINQTQKLIGDTFDRIKNLVIDKNIKYGNSAIDPVRIFSSSSNIEQILVRIDDKLSRIKNNPGPEDEDVIDDLIGYLVLYKVALEKEKGEQTND